MLPRHQPHRPTTPRPLAARSIASPRSLALLGLACPLLSGCVAGDNARNTIGHTVALEGLQPVTPVAPPIRPRQADTPSLRVSTVSRDHWSPRRFAMPVDTVAHQPAYAFNPAARTLFPVTARQRTDFPDQSTSLELTSDEQTRWQAIEGLAVPALAAIELAAAPFQMLFEPPWSDASSPSVPRDRLPIPPRLETIAGRPDGLSALPSAIPPGTEVDLNRLPDDWFVYAAGRWMTVREAKAMPPQSPAPAELEPAARPGTAPPLSPLPPETPNTIQNLRDLPDETQVFFDGRWTTAREARAAIAAAQAAQQPAGAPTTYEGLPDDAFVFRDGRWMTVREAKALLKPATPSPTPGSPKP
jgi:hypothetical protein